MFRKIIILFCCAMNFFAAFAQSSLLHGRVVDEVNGQPLSCANISLMEKEEIIQTAITDSNGAFVLKYIPKRSLSIKISYVGYFSSVCILDPFPTDTVLIGLITYPVELPEVSIQSTFPKIINPCIDCDMPGFGFQYVEAKIITRKAATTLPKGEIPHIIAMQTRMVYAADGGEDGLLYFAGSRSDANKYIIDGIVVIGDAHVPLQSIRWVDVTCFGFSAKYGDFTGGLIEVNTKSAFGF